MLQSLRSRFATATSNPSPVRPLHVPKQGMVLLEDLACGSHYAALNTAIVGSAFNALAHRRRFSRPRSLRNHLPRPPSARTAWSRLMQEMRQPEALAAALPAFLTHLSVVEKQVELFLNEIEAHGAQAVAQMHGGRLTQAARQMADLANAAIVAIDKVANGIIPLSYTRNMIMLRSFLQDVHGGGSPLVDRDGNIVVPELPQRRAPVRKAVYLKCVIEHRGKAAPVIATNISMTGVGLENAPPLVPKSVVVVEIGDRCFAGTVVWESGTSAAVKFDQPLRDDDPLLAD